MIAQKACVCHVVTDWESSPGNAAVSPMWWPWGKWALHLISCTSALTGPAEENQETLPLTACQPGDCGSLSLLLLHPLILSLTGFPDVLLCAHRGYKNTASSSGRTDLFEERGTPQSIAQFTWKSCSIERENERVKKRRRENKWEVTPVRSSTWLVFREWSSLWWRQESAVSQINGLLLS